MAESSLKQSAGADSTIVFHQRLRAETRLDHEAVDAEFGRFDLTDPGSYRRFLLAHAMALPDLETRLMPATIIPGWRGRTAALRADLAMLGAAMPAPDDTARPIEGASRWGALYVVEGSRLGGAVLSRQVGAGLPAAYLRAHHPKGAWRDFLTALDEEAQDETWRQSAIASARTVFATYLAAAQRVAHG